MRGARLDRRWRHHRAPASHGRRSWSAGRCQGRRRAASEVAERFGYSPANVHQMASDLRAGRAAFFRDSKPGPKGPRKTERIRDRVLALRAQDRSVEEIAAELTAAGSPVSAQTVWTILDAGGLERLARRAPTQRGAAAAA